MSIDKQEHSPITTTLRQYWPVVNRQKRDFWQSMLLPVSNILLSVFMPLLASKILAGLVANRGSQWPRFGLLVGVSALGVVFNGAGVRAAMRLQAKVIDDLNNLVFSRLLSRSVSFFTGQIGGKLVSQASDYSQAFGAIWNNGFIGLFSFMLTIVVGMVVLLLNSPVLALIIAALFAILTVWSRFDIKKRSYLRRERIKASSKMIGHFSDSLVNAVTVKTFAAESREEATSRHLNKTLLNIRLNNWLRTVTQETLRMGTLQVTQMALIASLIIMTAKHPHLLAAGIFAFTYSIGIMSRFFTINTMLRQLDDAFIQAAPMTEMLEQAPEIVDAPSARPLKVKRGAIEVRDVRFRYADAQVNDTVFEDLNLSIKPGEKVGLVGHSGGGKSTLTKLLLRFDDISAGMITIDDQDIAKVTQASLRASIGYVPQEPLLFHRSIRENIAYGRPEASQSDIEAAARQASAHEFIELLPSGYDTVVGERGVKLSGGQRQRVAIARPILKNSPILILDEATSALDSESEKAIQDALWQLMSGKTALVIAHRLSTIQRLDRIIVIDDGQITEQGSHQELLKAGGTYARLWQHQSGGFLKED